MLTGALTLITLLTLLSTVWGQPSIVPETRQYVKCSCRASNRGFSKNALNELKNTLVTLDEERRNLIEQSFTDPAINSEFIDKDLRRLAEEKWNHCVNNYSHEECVNVDTSLRIRGSRPATTMCYYNDKEDCSKVKEFASTNADIVAGNAEVKFVPPTPPKPNEPEPEPTALPPRKPTSEPKPEPKKKDAPKSDSKEPVATPTPGTVPASDPVPTPSKGDGDGEDKKASSDNGDSGSESNGGGDASGTGSADGEILSETPVPIEARLPPNEGCVAVEHLEGYHTQHKEDLMRRVLCGNGFCATPNHALIVDGVWTSMKSLCSSAGGWKCIESVKRVNNLDIFRNRRARVGSVTVTPFDIRFPRFAIWMAQFAERVYTSNTILSLVMTAVVAVAVSRMCWTTS